MVENPYLRRMFSTRVIVSAACMFMPTLYSRDTARMACTMSRVVSASDIGSTRTVIRPLALPWKALITRSHSRTATSGVS